MEVFKMSEKSKGYQMAQELTDFLNNFSPDDKGFVNGLMREHRTLQQNTFRLMVKTMEAWAAQYDNKMYDDRNEATCRLSKKITELLKDEYVPYI